MHYVTLVRRGSYVHFHKLWAKFYFKFLKLQTLKNKWKNISKKLVFYLSQYFSLKTWIFGKAAILKNWIIELKCGSLPRYNTYRKFKCTIQKLIKNTFSPLGSKKIYWIPTAKFWFSFFEPHGGIEKINSTYNTLGGNHISKCRCIFGLKWTSDPHYIFENRCARISYA